MGNSNLRFSNGSSLTEVNFHAIPIYNPDGWARVNVYNHIAKA